MIIVKFRDESNIKTEGISNIVSNYIYGRMEDGRYKMNRNDDNDKGGWASEYVYTEKLAPIKRIV